MTEEPVLSDVNGCIGRIVLNRPGMLNPLSGEVFALCRKALSEFRESGDVRVVVLTGAGRAFCAGADMHLLTDLLRQHPEARRAAMDGIMREGHALLRDLRAFPGPVVSLVNGPAVGGGVGLALTADIVLATNSAYFCLPFVPKLGLVPDLGGFAYLQMRIGTARAVAAALTGEVIDACTAAEWGLIWKSVADDSFADAAAGLLDRLAALPVAAATALRDMSVHMSGRRFDDWLDREREVQARLFALPDAGEGVSAFFEKRLPDFHGG